MSILTPKVLLILRILQVYFNLIIVQVDSLELQNLQSSSPFKGIFHNIVKKQEKWEDQSLGTWIAWEELLFHQLSALLLHIEYHLNQ